jgi:hypothetical protein
MNQGLTVHVRIGGGKNSGQGELVLPAGAATVCAALDAMAKTDWGRDCFLPGVQPPCLRAGQLLVLNCRMVQPWEFNQRPVADGDHLELAQVVPGG